MMIGKSHFPNNLAIYAHNNAILTSQSTYLLHRLNYYFLVYWPGTNNSAT